MAYSLVCYQIYFCRSSRQCPCRQVRLPVDDDLGWLDLYRGFWPQRLLQIHRRHVCDLWRHRRPWSRSVLRHCRRVHSILVWKTQDRRPRSCCQRYWVRHSCFLPAFHPFTFRIWLEGHLADHCWIFREYVRMRDADERSRLDNRDRVSQKICFTIKY